ncbi:MAG TPA: glycosyltransferase [Candidatus Thermoplasmatota archaeon]|nr:glycosyltransferase [Candidatus Thermoplasmatota archaeon]
MATGDDIAPLTFEGKRELSPPVRPPARPADPMVSVIVTVRNEAKNIADLLDSLLVQDGKYEVLIVDAASTDKTRDIVASYSEKHPQIRLLHHAGRRGDSRNYGVQQARGHAVAFIDGDCIANPFWLKNLKGQLMKTDVAAGRTIQIGYWAFESLHRVELRHKGSDVTHPSCNLAYWKDLFDGVGGFDPTFHTAEDIDLNYRAVDRGAVIGYTDQAIVYHRARDTFGKFFKQAYWNGYGRKQLTMKHGRLWNNYSFKEMFRTQFHFWGVLRLAAASVGYLVCKIKE